MKIKALGTQIALSTANTVSDSGLVRIANDTAGHVLITNSNGNTFTIMAGTAEIVVKQPTETLAAGSAVKAVPVAYY